MTRRTQKAILLALVLVAWLGMGLGFCTGAP